MTLHVERGGSQGRQRRGLAPPGPHLPEAPAPASAPPRGAPAHRAALAPKCVTGTSRAPPAARARLATGQRRPGQGCRAVSGAGTRAWKALKLRGSRRAVGGSLRGGQLARDRPPQPWGARRLHFPFGPPPPSFPPAEWQRRFPLGETTRILPGAPRPAPVLRPLPFAGEPVLARAREEALAACAGRWWQGAGEPLATNSPRHVTRSSAQ